MVVFHGRDGMKKEESEGDIDLVDSTQFVFLRIDIGNRVCKFHRHLLSKVLCND